MNSAQERAAAWRDEHIGTHLITVDYINAPDMLKALRDWTEHAYLAGYAACAENKEAPDAE